MRFASRQQRINRRLRKYRQEKILKEQSFNKNEVLQSFYAKSKKKQAGQKEGGTDEQNINIKEQVAKLTNQTQTFNLDDAINQMKKGKERKKFKESVELIVRLNVDPKQGDQNIRGICILPAGLGKSVKICVFADKDFEQKLQEMGVDIIGNEETLKKIAEGDIQFDKLIASTEQLPVLKPLAKILGPQGLMPNTKSGTLVKPANLLEAIQNAKAGQVEFRINDNADIMLKVGLREFENEKIKANLNELLVALAKKKPESVKGKYFVKGFIKSSLGHPIKLDLTTYQQMLS